MATFFKTQDGYTFLSPMLVEASNSHLHFSLLRDKDCEVGKRKNLLKGKKNVASEKISFQFTPYKSWALKKKLKKYWSKFLRRHPSVLLFAKKDASKKAELTGSIVSFILRTAINEITPVSSALADSVSPSFFELLTSLTS